MDVKQINFIDGEKAWRLIGDHDDDCMFEYSFYVPEAFFVSEAQRKTVKEYLTEAWNRRADE